MEEGFLKMHKTIMLAYHDIDSEEHRTEKADIPTIDTVVRLDEFRAQMKYLAGKGYSLLSVGQYLDRQNRGALSDRDMVLTFDDGHNSNHRYVMPVLREYGFSATFFVVSDFIGRHPYMGRKEIREMLKSGMEIGAHGMSHSYLTELPPSRVRQEVENSREAIEMCCGSRVDIFAYPGGHQNREVVASVRSAGYRAAVSCIHGRNTPGTDPFLLRRIEIRRGTSVQELKKALKTMNIFLFQCVDMTKYIMKKALGLRTYEYLRQNLYHLYPFKR